ncbi:hypothetical protein AVEN_216237-1, partial [Araneus ventricosus]
EATKRYRSCIHQLRYQAIEELSPTFRSIRCQLTDSRHDSNMGTESRALIAISGQGPAPTGGDIFRHPSAYLSGSFSSTYS